MTTAIKNVLAIIHETDQLQPVKGRPVKREMIDKILHAAMFTDSGTHLLPWKFIIINDPQVLDTLVECVFMPGIKTRPATCILVCVLPEEIAVSNHSVAVQESINAGDNVLFIAREMGLQANAAGLYPDEVLMDMVRAQVNIPPGVLPAKLVFIG